MRRALDAAILEIGTLGDRDRILDLFFEHAKTLFEFSVLFIVKGDSATGRSVHGLGAPPGLVARLNLPLSEPGILSRARQEAKVFIASGSPTEVDVHLFGNLGRAIPSALVAPIVVRDRVVAIFLADGPAERLLKQAHQAGRGPLELAQDEMLLWSATTGQVLERLILRRKAGDSAPPPRPSWLPATIPPIAPPARLPSNLVPTNLEGTAPAASSASPAFTNAAPPDAKPAKRGRAVFALLVIALTAGIGAFGRSYLDRRETTDFDRVVLPGAKLKGWPRVDPTAAIEAARSASGLDGKAELGSIEAEVVSGGLVDFGTPVQNRDGIYLKLVFVTDVAESVVGIDSGGVRAPRIQGRSLCADRVCRPPVPPPQCTFANIFDASLKAGLTPADHPTIAYTSEGGAPGWLVTVADRGSIRVDATTCAPFARERLRPPSLPVGKIPGAPKDVDPLAIAQLAQEQSGLESDALLLEIEARGVGPDGHVDLTSPGAGIVYVFADPVASTARRWRQIRVGPDGIPVVSGDGDREPLPVRFFRSETPAPRCTFAEARAYLTKSQAAADRVRLTYGPDPATQLGTWTIESVSARQTSSDSECQVWAKSRDKDKTAPPKK